MQSAMINQLQQRTLDEIGEVWQPNKLMLPRLPVIFGAVANKAPFDAPVTAQSSFNTAQLPQGASAVETPEDPTFITEHGLYIEDLPIKFPGTGYRIPKIVWDNFGDLLKQEIELERQINPHLDDQYIYLTIQQSQVVKDNTHRPSGVHIDGFQKPIIIPQPVQHQIAVSNILPTKFYATALQNDPSGLTKKEIFNALAQNCQSVMPYRLPAHTIHLLNGYCPHEPDAASVDGFRTFVRFSASSIPFMGQDNTRNSLFNYNWDKQSKDDFYKNITKPEFS